MVVVSMVPRVQSHNKITLLCISCFFALFFGCRNHEFRIVNASEHSYFTAGGITYVDSVPYSGMVYDLYPNSDTMFVYEYLQGKQHGRSVEWYASGQVKEIRLYSDNWKEGTHKGWFENGTPKFVVNYNRDVYDGNVREWLESGQLFKDFNYKDGQEEGMQRMYWADGKIRANYQCINGRNYGLTGVKNCISVWADSIGH